MQVKIDTKEKFHVITIKEPILAANLAADLAQLVTKFLQEDIKNVVLKLEEVTTIDQEAAEALVKLQHTFYEHSGSFVICGLQEGVEKKLDELELLELMNITPTESEAWDIVQMEEIERELMDSNDGEFLSKDE